MEFSTIARERLQYTGNIRFPTSAFSYVGIKSVVISYVNDLPPDHLMSSINYPLKKVQLDENKSDIINSC